MELEEMNSNSSIGKKLWKLLRLTFLMITRKLTSNAKMIVHMSFMVKRTNKLIHRSLMDNVMSFRQYSSQFPSSAQISGNYGVSEYEFSCNNSPALFYNPTKKKNSIFLIFPCLNPAVLNEALWNHDRVVIPNRTPDYLFDRYDSPVKHDGHSSLLLSPYTNTNIHDHLWEEEAGESNGKVDHAAEEFIKRFYEQLRVQSPLEPWCMIVN